MYDNTRGEGSSTRLGHPRPVQQQYGQSTSSTVPTREGLDFRSRVSPTATPPANNTNAPNMNGNGRENQLSFDLYPEQGGRRRAETVTGVTGVGETSPHTHQLHYRLHPRIQQPTSVRTFVPAPTARADGPSPPATRSARGDNESEGAGSFRMNIEDYDMVLG